MYLIFHVCSVLLIAATSTAKADLKPGDMLDTSPGNMLDASHTKGPAGCESTPYPALFWSTSNRTPLDENGHPEFNEYRLFACPNTHDLKRLVLWRIRPHGGGLQLVGQAELPPDAVRKARRFVAKSKDKASLAITIASCFRSNGDIAEVDALAVGGFEAGEPVDRTRIIYSWAINASKMTVEQIPVTSLTACSGG